jgi:hypothetical protein
MQLFDLIDAVNDAYFWNGSIPASDRMKIATQIADTQGKPRAYANMFALSESECRKGIQLFTGELATCAGARHIAGEEACRALLLLNVQDAKVQGSLARASEGIMKTLIASEREHRDARMGGNPGTFCCGRCSVSVWRHASAGGLDRKEERWAGGLKRLRTFRTANGKWSSFPFWYTLSAMAEMDIPQVKAEIKYVAATLERAAKRTTAKTRFDERRAEIARRCLAKI